MRIRHVQGVLLLLALTTGCGSTEPGTASAVAQA